MQQARIETVRQPAARPVVQSPIQSPAQSLTRAAGPALTEAMVGELVRHLYGRVHDDALLGPMFRMSAPDWEEHLEEVTDFWSHVLLGTGRYEGGIMGLTGTLRMKPAHFERWMALFRASAEALLPPGACRQAFDAASVIDLRLRAWQAQLQQPD